MSTMLLTEEITLPCGLRIPNRLVKAAMVEGMANHTHGPNEQYATLFGQWGDGGWGLIITGNVMVSDLYHGSPADVQIPRNGSSPSQQDQWKTWAATCQRGGTPAIVQLCHPGRQSPIGAGSRSIFAKAIAPSAVKLDLGKSMIARAAVSLMFGTPRAMTVDEISGPDGVIAQFVAGAKQVYDAGFKGVEIHGSHGYLLTTFMSPKTNHRTDDFGGTAAKRVEVVLRIIRGIREQTPPEFCIGVKLNSVDAASSDLEDVLEQIKLISECGIDFIEISGGTYEDPRMMADAVSTPAEPAPKQSTLQRESFFLEFAQTVRARFPSVKLMVTGGFRTRLGMEEALRSGGCDLIGIARPAAILPKLPAEIILNFKDVSDQDATVQMRTIPIPWWVDQIPIRALGLGMKTEVYGKQLQRMGKGLPPVDLRIKA